MSSFQSWVLSMRALVKLRQILISLGSKTKAIPETLIVVIHQAFPYKQEDFSRTILMLLIEQL